MGQDVGADVVQGDVNDCSARTGRKRRVPKRFDGFVMYK